MPLLEPIEIFITVNAAFLTIKEFLIILFSKYKDKVELILIKK